MTINVATMTIDYNGGRPIFNPSPPPTDLHKGDTVTIDLRNFPSNTSITELDFFHNQVVNGKDKKNESAPLGDWQRSSGNGPGLTGKFSVAATAGTQEQVLIEDVETLAQGQEDKYWLTVRGSIGTSTWQADPELINKSGAHHH